DYKSYVELNYAPNTSNHNLIALRGLFDYAGMSDVSSSIKIKNLANQNDTKWVERTDVQKLYHEIEIHSKWNDARKAMNRAIVTILVNCGLRVAELSDLKRSDVLPELGLINVRNGKGNKFRRVPFGEKTSNIIGEWLTYHDGESDYLFYSQRSPQ